MLSMRRAPLCLLFLPLVSGSAAATVPALATSTPTPITVSTATSPDSFLLPVSAVAADGSVSVAWSVAVTTTNSANVHVRRFDAAGSPIGIERVANTTGSSGGVAIRNNATSIGSDAAGNFVVAWYQITDTTSDLELKARLFSANGLPRTGEFCVDPSCSLVFVGSSQVAMADDGRFVVAYTTGNGTATTVYVRRFAADGTALDAQPVAVVSLGNFMGYSIGMNRQTGDFTVSWMTEQKYGLYIKHNVRTVTTLNAQRYASDGSPAGGAMNITTCVDKLNWFGIESGCQLFGNGQALVDNSGNLTFAWSQFSAKSATAPVTYVRHYDANGTATGPMTQLAGSLLNGAAGDGAGNYVLKLDSGTRAYSATDVRLDTPTQLDLSSSLSGSSSGGFVGSWMIGNQGTYTIYAQPYTLP